MNQGRSADGNGPPNGPAPACADCPETGPIRRTVRVINPRGLHPRIIDLFTKTAKGFASVVTLWNGELRANGKDVWDLITLVVLPDSDVVLEVDGPDAATAVEPLARILASPGGEDYTI
ncbi:MAG TPA: HPr family phosphocarrier protein [Gemmataceae bacterium]|nr:HPr family phosphocarrier protein [Gemmataceae bacterium]